MTIPSTTLTISTLKRYLHQWGLTIAYLLCRALPIDWVSGFGAWRGRYRGQQAGVLEARVRQNLAIICPDQDADVIVPALRRAAGRAALETFIADRIVKDGRIHWHDCQALDQAVAQQQSIVFVLAHLDNLGDVLGAAIVERFDAAKEHAVLTRQIKEPTLAHLIRRTRLLSLGARQGWIEAPNPGVAKRALLTLKQGPSTLVLHVDEARQHQVHVPSFGRPLSAKGTNIHYAVRFAKRSGACLAVLNMRRNADRPTHFDVCPLLIHDMSLPNHQTTPDSTIITAIDQALAQQIQSDPATWLQLYHLRML